MTVPTDMLLQALLVLTALACAPLLPGIMVKVKAAFAGRRGAPLLQVYYDVAKLLHKGAVYSRTTSWVFVAGPVLTLAAVTVALLCVPWAGGPALLAFPGDFVFLAYVLGMARFMTMLAALDTGSSFEGMGASREAWFAVLAEPALMVCFLALARASGAASMSGMMNGGAADTNQLTFAVHLLVAAALFVLALADNARIPVDDPATHLELTMIHEVMVLDHSGPDLGMIQYAATLKLWLFGGLIVNVSCMPWLPAHALVRTATLLGGMLVYAVVIGVVESSMARLRLVRVPQLLVGAAALGALAFLLTLGH